MPATQRAMGQRRRSPGAAEQGCAAEGAAGSGRGRLAESWRRLSSRRGSAKRGGPSAPAQLVSATGPGRGTLHPRHLVNPGLRGGGGKKHCRALGLGISLAVR